MDITYARMTIIRTETHSFIKTVDLLDEYNRCDEGESYIIFTFFVLFRREF